MITEEAMKYLRSLNGFAEVVSREAVGPVWPSVVVAIPEGSELASLEKFQVAPNRIEHRAVLDSSGAFIEYVNRFKGPSTSVYLSIFDSDPSFAAVLDHHDPEKPAWGSHAARFFPRVSLEWKAWTELHNGGEVKQQELLAFFEDHMNDLNEPAPTVMLQHMQKFEQVEKHTYSSAMNLDNGNISVTYTKDGGARKVEFPHTLEISIPVIENERRITLTGRLRFRTAEGKIGFTFQFRQDPARILRDVLRDLADHIKGDTGVHCYEGRVQK